MTTYDDRETFERATLIYNACSRLGWRGNPREIAEKVNQLRRGLPKEDEFTALAVWMGKCLIIHKLEQEQFPGLSREKYQVPDFLAVFDFHGRTVTTLIEVKTTSDVRLKPFTNAYYCRLANYASLLNLPLLIAWRIERLDLWCLFELERMKKKRTAFHINFQTAMNNSLLGILLDDVIFTVKRGNKVSFRIRKEPGSEVRDLKSGKLQQFTGILEEIVWSSSTNQKIASDSALARFLELVFFLVDNDVCETEDENYVTLGFYTTQEENLFAHQLLGVVALGSAIFRDERPSWLEVIRRNIFRMDYQSMRSAASEGVKKGVVRSIIRQKPVIPPKFVNL